MPRVRHHARAWGRATVLLLPVLCLACAQDDEDQRGSVAAADTAGAASGTMRIADFTDVTTFDPVLSQNTQAAYLLPVYDTLVRQDADQKLVPHLATAWTEVDERTLRFTLRDDVVFHDGSRLDAAAVKANLDRARTTEANPNAPTFATVSDVVVVDPTTVEVRFSGPHPTFLTDMTLVQGMMVSPEAIATGLDLTRDPHGSGGWIWSADESQDGVRQGFVRNEQYWAPELQGVARFEINAISDNPARFNALETGQLDLIYAVPPGQVGAAESAGFDVLSYDVDFHFVLITDRGGQLAPPLADPRVRQAIGHAIDREGYVDAVLAGVGSASGGLLSPSLTDWYAETTADQPTFDPELARELLTEAGYQDGFELTLPALALLQVNNEALAQMLGDVGITVRFAQLQAGQLGPEMRKGSYAATLTAATQYHPQQFLTTYLSGQGPFNPFGMTDTAAIDDGLAAAAGAEPNEAKSLYTDVQVAAMEAGMMFPVAFAPVSIVAADTVEQAFVPRGLRVASPYGLRLTTS